MWKKLKNLSKIFIKYKNDQKLIFKIIIVFNWILFFPSIYFNFITIITIVSMLYMIMTKSNLSKLLYLPLVFIFSIQSIFTIYSYSTGQGKFYLYNPEDFDLKYRVNYKPTLFPFGYLKNWRDNYSDFLLKILISTFGYQRNSYKGYLPDREYFQNFSTEYFSISDYSEYGSSINEKDSFHAIRISELKRTIYIPIIYFPYLGYYSNFYWNFLFSGVKYKKLKYKIINNELLILVLTTSEFVYAKKNEFELILLIDNKTGEYLMLIKRKKDTSPSGKSGEN